MASMIGSFIPPIVGTVSTMFETHAGACFTMRFLHMVHSIDIAMQSVMLGQHKGAWVSPFVMKFNAFLVTNLLFWVMRFDCSNFLPFNEPAFADFVLIFLTLGWAFGKCRVVRETVYVIKTGNLANASGCKKYGLLVARLGYYLLFSVARIMAVFTVASALTTAPAIIRFASILTLLEFNCVFKHFVINGKRSAGRPFWLMFAQSVAVAALVTLLPQLRVLVILLIAARHLVPCLRAFLHLLPKTKAGKKASKKN